MIMPSDDAVFLRTVRGQQAVVGGTPSLDDTERRLLLIVNGETPLGHLARLAPTAARPPVAHRLMHAGLISTVVNGHARPGPR